MNHDLPMPQENMSGEMIDEIIDEEAFEEFKSLAEDLRLSEEQAQGIWDWIVEGALRFIGDLDVKAQAYCNETENQLRSVYGRDFEAKQIRLADLVRQVDAIEGIQRLRISSIDPDEIDENLADAVLYSKHTCASMHVVLQSGSNTILKRMNRKYTREIFLETIDRLRKANPDFTFTTDVIVGFPGESELDFQDTLAVMDYVRFAKVHMFPYSPRPRTRAALYPNRIDPTVINTRKRQVLRLAEEHAYFLREKYVGSTLPVLIEETEGVTSGHTENFLHVISQDKGLKSNDLVEMQLYANTPEGLLGKII